MTLANAYSFLFIVVCASFLHTSEVPLHLIINDPHSALKAINEEVASHGEKEIHLKWKIQCASKLCDEELLLSTYKRFAETYPDKAYDHEILEYVAWGVIKKTTFSSSPLIRSEGAFAALVSNDAQGIPLFKSTLQDSNVTVRLIACSLAAHLKDEIIEKVISDTAFNDPSQEVQKQAIHTLGAMQAKAAYKLLETLLEKETTPLEQKQAALGALIEILPAIDDAFLTPLVKSRYPFLRALACNLVCSRHLEKELLLIIPLLNDPNQEVRMSALEAIGIVASDTCVQQENVCNSIKSLVEHPDWKQSIRANWVLALRGNENDAHDAQNRLLAWIKGTHSDARFLAASALTRTGTRCVGAVATCLQNCTDPYLTINLGVGLVYQRQHTSFAAHCIEQAMQKIEERLSWHSSGIFSWIGQTTIRHQEAQARLPETQDFLTRLELYSILATCGVHNLSHKLKTFFQESGWGVSGSATTLLLQEGDPHAQEILHTLLEDPSNEVSLQSACILALYTQEEKALHILEEHWVKATRQQKEFILYAIGQIGSKNSLPFLKKVLDEPFQTLRIRAASAILQCLWK